MANKIPPPPSDEAARYSIDVLKKWADAMYLQWSEVRQQMADAGLRPEGPLKIGTVAVMERSFQLVVKNNLMPMVMAIHDINFDVTTLPEIRRLTLETLDACRQKVEAKKAADLKARMDHDAKLADVLPKIVSEFGADVVQYGDPSQQKQSHPKLDSNIINVAAPGYLSGADVLTMSSQTFVGSGSDFQDSVNELDRRLKEIERRAAAREDAQRKFQEIQRRIGPIAREVRDLEGGEKP